MSDAFHQFKTTMLAAGLTPPDVTETGKEYRFPGSGKSAKNNAAWCFMFDDMRGGVFGDFSTGLESTWQIQNAKPYTEAERQANRERIQAMQRQRQDDLAKRQQQAAADAQKRWAAAKPCSDHSYLTPKGVQAHGVRVEADGFLIVPMRDTDAKLWNIERINPKDGSDKKGLYGGRRTGLYFSIGKPNGSVIVCEGFATGASIHKATGDAVAIAFNAGNLEAVATALRTRYQDLKIIVAADDDHLTVGNPGLTKARAAALAVGGYLAVPDFGSDRPDKATDFNDLHQIVSAGAVKRCIDSATQIVASHAGDTGATGQFDTKRLPKTSVVLTCGADLTPEPMQWLWQDWLALGKFHLLAGAPGQGKTTIAMAVAATVTNGGRWPDGSRCDAGNVLIWSGEDDYTDTLLPRLIAAGADRNRVFFVDGTRTGDAIRPFDPSTDTRTLKEAIQQIGSVRLIVIDPVSTAVAGDSHKNTEVRRGLQPLVDLATTINAALLGITHLSKGGQGSDPAQRVIGSIAFTAVARVVLVAARVKGEDGADKRILARSKSNIGPDNGGFEYQLVQVEALPGIDASCIEWGQAVEGSARDLLTDPAEGDDGTDHADAVSLLKAELTADCWTGANQATQPLKDAGFTKKQIWTASKKLKVVRTKGGMGGGWYWRLPGGSDMELPGEDSKSPEGSEDSPSEKQEPLESSAIDQAADELVEVEL